MLSSSNLFLQSDAMVGLCKRKSTKNLHKFSNPKDNASWMWVQKESTKDCNSWRRINCGKELYAFISFPKITFLFIKASFLSRVEL